MIDPRISHFPPDDISKKDAPPRRFGPMLGTTVYLGALTAAAAYAMDIGWTDIVRPFKKFFGRGRG